MKRIPLPARSQLCQKEGSPRKGCVVGCSALSFERAAVLEGENGVLLGGPGRREKM